MQNIVIQLIRVTVIECYTSILIFPLLWRRDLNIYCTLFELCLCKDLCPSNYPGTLLRYQLPVTAHIRGARG